MSSLRLRNFPIMSIEQKMAEDIDFNEVIVVHRLQKKLEKPHCNLRVLYTL